MAWIAWDSTKSSGGGTQYADLLALESGSNAFDLTDTDTPTEATNIPRNMFIYGKVKNISLANIIRVNDDAFSNSGYIGDINLPSCIEVKGGAFRYTGGNSGHTRAKIVNLPEVVTIGNEAFRGYSFLSSQNSKVTLNFPKLQTTGSRCFQAMGGSDKTYFALLNFPSIKTLGYACFMNCYIDVLKIGASCTGIGGALVDSGSIDIVVCERTTPPTFSGFGGGSPAPSPTHIYVPSASVATYQAANGWSTYSSVIEAMPTVTLDVNSKSLAVNETYQLTATTDPSGETVTFTSSDSDVATVSSSGLITGVATGTATITASITVTGVDFTTTCEVTVS